MIWLIITWKSAGWWPIFLRILGGECSDVFYCWAFG